MKYLLIVLTITLLGFSGTTSEAPSIAINEVSLDTLTTITVIIERSGDGMVGYRINSKWSEHKADINTIGREVSNHLLQLLEDAKRPVKKI